MIEFIECKEHELVDCDNTCKALLHAMLNIPIDHKHCKVCSAIECKMLINMPLHSTMIRNL